ncbi:hypothetical protein SXM_0594 [Shewanella xiamenensis]|nr:hypothetical protein SXM_0594 [Shewanella xiamenensis]
MQQYQQGKIMWQFNIGLRQCPSRSLCFDMSQFGIGLLKIASPRQQGSRGANSTNKPS